MGVRHGGTIRIVTPTNLPVPASVLLWRPDEPPERGPEELGSICCLRSTAHGDRAVVYRTAAGQGLVAVVDFLSDAVPRPGGGWCAPGVVRRVDPWIPRDALLADEAMRPVFAHIRSRRGLPADAARRLAALLPAVLVDATGPQVATATRPEAPVSPAGTTRPSRRG